MSANDDHLEGPATVNRRDAIKKAAAGAGVAATAWVAPRVEGLSIVPDYASAATIAVNTMASFARHQTDCESPGIDASDNNCWGTCGPGDSCAPVTVTYNLPGVGPDMGNYSFTAVYAGRADTNGDGNITVTFPPLDPPFGATMCAVTAASGDPGPGGTGQDLVISGNMVAIDQSPVNQGNDVTFTITCT